MNLQESDSFKEQIEKNTRQRKTVMLSIVVCAMIAALLFVMIMILKYQDSITLKMFLDGKQISIPKGLYRDIDGKVYFDVKKLGDLLGYVYTKGVYGEYNEEVDSCYLQNDHEIVAITADAPKFIKYLELSKNATKIADIKVSMIEPNGYSESFSMADAPAKYIDDKIYICKDYVTEMFNLKIDWQEYRIRLYTLADTVADTQKAVIKAGYNKYDGNYENLRASLYGYAIVGNDAGEWGVYSVKDKEELFSLKYDKIEFVQNTKDFYITVADGTMGILAEDGRAIVKTSLYKNIKLLDEEQRLYVVQKDKEYGVLNKNGEVIIHPENDNIGYKVDKFKVEHIDNPSLFFGKCIPVQKDGKYGLYNVEGEQLLALVNDAFGCITHATSQTSGNKQNVLLIPSQVGINGIVYSFNGYYGVYDVNEEKPIIPPACESVYAITKGGQTTYYFDYQGATYDLKQYLIDKGLNNVSDEEEPAPVVEETPTTDETANVTE